MKPLDLRAAAKAARGRALRLFLDFDGTLSPHRPDGENSAPLPETLAALQALVRRPGSRVFIVSGRPVRDLRRRVAVRGLAYAGNHGLEIRGPREVFRHPLSEVASRAVAAAAGLVRKRIADYRGFEICRNGMTMSFNVGRMGPAGRRAAAQVVAATADEMRWLSLRWREGHLGWDLVPQLDWGKGDAVSHVMRGCENALAVAVGDGWSDESVFEAVNGGGLSVRVGYSPRSAARYYVRGPGGVARLLRALL